MTPLRDGPFGTAVNTSLKGPSRIDVTALAAVVTAPKAARTFGKYVGLFEAPTSRAAPLFC